MDDILERRRNVTVIGAGVIGASWVAVFLAHGLKVTVQDPRAGVDAEVRGYVDRAADSLRALGCSDALIASQLIRHHLAAGDFQLHRAAIFVDRFTRPLAVDFSGDLMPQ